MAKVNADIKVTITLEGKAEVEDLIKTLESNIYKCETALKDDEISTTAGIKIRLQYSIDFSKDLIKKIKERISL